MKIFKKALAAATASIMAASACIIDVSSLGTADAAGSQSAIDLVNDMGLGWNLGNTFDAWGSEYQDGSCPAEKYETIWGNSKTTQAMISEIHKYGFNSVRIPVTFYKCTDPNTFDISDDYLARVKEVVDYCVTEGMYAIIDMHWDWVDPNTSGNPTLWLNKGLDSEAQFKAMWTEIANYFKSYDNHVVFQDMNEVWWENNYTSASSKSYTVLNTLNQDFVDVVRATGGNNATVFSSSPALTLTLQRLSAALTRFRTTAWLPLISTTTHRLRSALLRRIQHGATPQHGALLLKRLLLLQISTSSSQDSLTTISPLSSASTAFSQIRARTFPLSRLSSRPLPVPLTQ